MIDYNIIFALISFYFVMYVTPGPNNAMVLTSGIKFGFTKTIPHMTGITIGHVLQLILVCFGLGKIFQIFPQIQNILKIVCALYLDGATNIPTILSNFCQITRGDTICECIFTENPYRYNSRNDRMFSLPICHWRGTEYQLAPEQLCYYCSRNQSNAGWVNYLRRIYRMKGNGLSSIDILRYISLMAWYTIPFPLLTDNIYSMRFKNI